MNINTGIMLAIFLLLGIIIITNQGLAGIKAGMNESIGTFKNVWLMLVLAFGITGFLTVLIPQQVISEYIGAKSGWKGLFIGWGLGAILPGAPYTILSVAASFLKAGSI